MPDYDSPRVLREQAYWREDWRERFYPKSKKPNRRGNYPNGTKWGFRSKFYFREGQRPRKWSHAKQRASANRAEGTRSKKRRKVAREANIRGFQHAWVPPEKPKVPRRILADAQEERLWRDETP